MANILLFFLPCGCGSSEDFPGWWGSVGLAGARVTAAGMPRWQGGLRQAAASRCVAPAAAGGSFGALDSQRCVPGEQLMPSQGLEPAVEAIPKSGVCAGQGQQGERERAGC